MAILIVNLDQGFDSPLFSEGVLRGGSEPLDAEALESLSLEELEALFLASSVMEQRYFEEFSEDVSRERARPRGRNRVRYSSAPP